MGYSKTVIILPGYSLDSLPYDIDDQQAAGLLNALAVAAHPLLLADARRMPEWRGCDDYPDGDAEALFLVPPVSEDHLHGSWLVDGAPATGVVRGITDRTELLTAALAEAGVEQLETDARLTAELMSLGMAHALMELLTQQMHYFTNIDEEVLAQNAIAAAQAIRCGDEALATSHLTAAFETLVEARERFYPVDCYLLDLCLLNQEQAEDHLADAMQADMPINLLLEGRDAASLSQNTAALIRQRLVPSDESAPIAALLGGEYSSLPAPLIPLTDWLADFDRGRHSFRQQFGQAPRAWARKRFGFSPLLPQVLRNYGYRIALHIALDDGTYPDAEHSKLTWEGNDGTAIDALSRIPIAIDSAAAFLQLPQRIAESMQEDMVAAVVFARWPEVREPWLADFQRMHRYGSVFGRFVTIDEFAEDSGDSGHCAKYEAREYLTPFLIQGSALGQPRPVSRFSLRTQQRADADAARACAAVASLIAPDADLQNQSRSLHELLLAVDEAEPVTDQTRQATTKLQTQAMTRMAERCGADTSAADGVLVFNPLSFARRIPVSIPRPGKEADTTLVEVPGLGFAWTTGETSAQPKLKVPLATTELMHNGIYEIHLNPKTGGIGSIKGFGRSPNRLSQQVAFRFERPQPAGVDEDGDAVTSSYSRMECRDVRVLCSDQTTGQVETTGDLVSPTDGERLASFRQTMTVVRSSPNLDIEIELTDIAELPSGNPWLCYYGCRFAWDDAAAALTRSVFGQAQGFAGERFESPHYFEIASAEERTTIVSHGLPFYRRTDLRMADCLMVVESEQQRRFRYSVVLDQPYPLRAALDCMTPALTTSCGPPAAGQTGWFVRVQPGNVCVIDMVPEQPRAGSCTFRLMETEGRAASGTLTCFRPPHAARKVDFQGEPVEELVVDADGNVTIDFRRFELCDVLVEF